MICRLLLALCSLFRTRFLCFHQIAASFCKMPGGVSQMLLRDAAVAWASRSGLWTLGGSRRRLPVPEIRVRDAGGGVSPSRLWTLGGGRGTPSRAAAKTTFCLPKYLYK